MIQSRERWPHWYTVVLLCGAAVFISCIDRTNISVASIAMQEQFSWTETPKGYVLSSFFVGYVRECGWPSPFYIFGSDRVRPSGAAIPERAHTVGSRWSGSGVAYGRCTPPAR
ncbi:MAG: hypothetical protein O2973_01805 [Gemmatimonadetes bacterium]|nr:hypothetical protein [Gemmatimonadota bacterium]